MSSCEPLRILLALLGGAVLLVCATMSRGQSTTTNTPQVGRSPHFDAALLEPIADRTREIRENERDLMSRVLAHAAQFPLAEKRKTAENLIADRRARMPEFQDRSDSEFVVEDLIRTPDFYRGKLLKLDGYTRGVEQIPPREDARDPSPRYKLRLFVEEGDSSPVDIYFQSLPEDWPADREVIDDVAVVGYFLKLIEYDDRQTGQAAYAPVILAERIEWLPKIQRGRVRIDPALWTGVVHHKRRGWTNAERDLYYRVLKHAQQGDYGQQKEAARKTLLARIEQYRDEVRAEHARLIERADRFLQRHPDQQAEYERQIADADARQRAKLKRYMKYREKPGLFPTYADLVINDHNAYNAQLVTLRGRVRQITKTPADENVRYDLGTLYEVWFYTEDSQNHPALVFSTSVPKGLMEKVHEEGERLDEQITVTGYFFKMYVYEAHDADRFAPMFLAQRIEWRPAQKLPSPLNPLYVLLPIALLVAGAAGFIWKTRREDRRFHERLVAAQAEPVGEAGAVNFEGIEANDEPHFLDHGEQAAADDTGVESKSDSQVESDAEAQAGPDGKSTAESDVESEGDEKPTA